MMPAATTEAFTGRDALDDTPALAPPAPIGRRFAAGVIDFLLLSALGGVLSLSPLSYGGLALPMIGALIAVTMYSVAPTALFKATLGMRIMGIEIVHMNGRAADATELAFRDLVGRGLLGVAYFATALLGVLGQLSGAMAWFIPSGIGLLLFMLSGLLVAIGLVSHFMILGNKDHRGFHDLMAKTIVVLRGDGAAPAGEDEEERTWRERSRKKKIIGIVGLELALAALALVLPFALSRAPTEAGLEDRVALLRAQKEFEKNPADPGAADDLMRALAANGETEKVEAIAKQHEAAKKIADANAQSYQVQKYRTLLKNAPCDLGYAIQLGNELNRSRDYQGAIDFVNDFLAKCGEHPRLLWVSEYAHKQKKEYELSADVCTKLIADRPHDSDFWWWRGENWASANKPERAESDFRHSMAARPNGFAAFRFAKLVEKSNPCEGAFAIQSFMESFPDEVEDWGPRMKADLFLAGGCEDRLGKGSVAIPIDRETAIAKTRVKVNEKEGSFLVYNTGFVTVTKKFAERAGISGGEVAVPVFIAGKYPDAHLGLAASVAVRGARAKSVPVAIVDELPSGVDGFIGQSFLQRFAVTRDERTLKLAARSAR